MSWWAQRGLLAPVRAAIPPVVPRCHSTGSIPTRCHTEPKGWEIWTHPIPPGFILLTSWTFAQPTALAHQLIWRLSVDRLTGGRLVLGVASGDRPVDPPCRPLRTQFE